MSHSYQSALMDRERSFETAEPIYLTEEEYQIYKYLDTADYIFPETPEAQAVFKKLAGKDIRNIQVYPDRRVIKKQKDMRSAIDLPPEPNEQRYPRATDVSSHPHAVGKSDVGKLFASDYFLPNQNEYDVSFVPLQRREDKTPLSPIIGQGKALLATVVPQHGIFAGKQSAFQGAIPDAYKQGFITLSQE